MSTPWPNNAKAALSLTLDNLGEAQAVHNHTHPPTQPYGAHPAVHTTLPRILTMLRSGTSGGIRATYFAEAWALQHYPSAVAALRGDGHEIAWHGWQHEVWATLTTEEEERALFVRSWEAAAATAGEGMGVRYKGFRPPGGTVNGARTMGLLKEFGCSYLSPEVGEAAFGMDDGNGSGGLVVLPFAWEAVDAFWYMANPKFEALRRARGFDEPEKARTPAQFREALFAQIEELKKKKGGGGYASVLFHPFLMTVPEASEHECEERFAVMQEVVQRIAADHELWVAPCQEVAAWVQAHQADFGFLKSE